MFKQHLQMIGYNETPNKKAKFWQSYVRSLKGKLRETFRTIFIFSDTKGETAKHRTTRAFVFFSSTAKI